MSCRVCKAKAWLMKYRGKREVDPPEVLYYKNLIINCLNISRYRLAAGINKFNQGR